MPRERTTPRRASDVVHRGGVITAVEPQQRRAGRRWNVFVDGRYAFSVEAELAASLKVGQPISSLRTADLLRDDEYRRCYEAAIRFLSVRPRSEREVRQRLDRHGFAPEMMDRAVERLRELDLVDDAAFASYWVEQRQTHRPRGSRLLKLELRQKGLATDVAVEALAELGDESESAYAAGSTRVRALRGLDERAFRQRLTGFLQRRGFDYESAASAVERLWREVESEASG
jgi:regulatory protein